MSWLWIFFLTLFFLTGIAFIVFLILFALKKKFALVGLCISGAFMLISFLCFAISGAYTIFTAYETSTSYENVNLDDEMNDDEDDLTSEEDELHSDVYEVGEDIPEGEYILIGGEYGYLEVSSEDSGDIEDVIYNDILNEEESIYITLKNGQYFTYNEAELFTLDDAPSLKPKDGIYHTGMYKVGEDIPAGEYEIKFDKENSSVDSGYVEIAKNSSHDVEDIVHNDLIEKNAEVTLEKGQYVTLRDVILDTEKK